MGTKWTTTASGSGRWTESGAREALEEFAQSGMSLAAFARDRGVSTQRFAYWRRRLVERQPPAFVSVALPGVEATRPTGVEILVSGVVVRLPSDVDAERVAGIVQALARGRQGVSPPRAT